MYRGDGQGRRQVHGELTLTVGDTWIDTDICRYVSTHVGVVVTVLHFNHELHPWLNKYDPVGVNPLYLKIVSTPIKIKPVLVFTHIL